MADAVLCRLSLAVVACAPVGCSGGEEPASADDLVGFVRERIEEAVEIVARYDDAVAESARAGIRDQRQLGAALAPARAELAGFLAQHTAPSLTVDWEGDAAQSYLQDLFTDIGGIHVGMMEYRLELRRTYEADGAARAEVTLWLEPGKLATAAIAGGEIVVFVARPQHEWKFDGLPMFASDPVADFQSWLSRGGKRALPVEHRESLQGFLSLPPSGLETLEWTEESGGMKARFRCTDRDGAAVEIAAARSHIGWEILQVVPQ